MKKVLTLFATAILIISTGFSQTFPAGFSTTNVSSGWIQPVGACFTPDGQKMFVWEKRGQVWMLNRAANGTYTKQATPVLDISQEVGDWRDFGLLGFALDPAFATNGNIYLLYVVDRHYLMKFGTGAYNANTNEYYNATIGRVTRYKTATSGGNLTATLNTRKILLGETPSTGIPILHESHGVGSLVFAADGTLLISAGDGASYTTTDPGNLYALVPRPNTNPVIIDTVQTTYHRQAMLDGIIRPEENVGAFRSQMLNSHNGKLLRIDPSNGNGIPSNPFYSAAAPRSAKSRVWAFGFRNPFRFTIKPGTGSTNPATGDIGEIYIGDVGWNNWEELSIINEKGANCGWPLFEGHTTVSNYANLSVENKDEPNPLYNGGSCSQPFFMFKSLVKQATADNIKTVFNPCNSSQAIGTNNRYFHHRPAMDWQHGADVARVGIFSGNNAAVATIGTPQSNVNGTPFRGNCAVAGTWYTGTLFPAGYRNVYFEADYGGKWLKMMTIDFVDQVQNVQNFATNFTAIVCIAQNPLDGTLAIVDVGSETVKRLTYGGNQFPVVKMTSNKTFGPSTLNVTFTGNQSSDPDGNISTYAWNFGDATTSNVANPPAHNFTSAGNVPKKFVVKLTVTDNGGASSVDSIIISVNNTPPIVNITSPAKNSLYKIGSDSLYILGATVTDAQQSGAQLSYAWQTILRHNNHQHAEPVVNAVAPNSMISRIGCNGDEYYWYVQLTVTDAAGLSTIDSSKIFPNCLQSPLPIVLRKFSVTQDGGTNLVRWTTEQEENMQYFEVERSTNGINFSPINWQPARNQPLPSNYSFADNSFPPGVNYYRLKIVEIDNKTIYSAVVKTVTDIESNGLTIMPNPNKGNFSLTFNSLTAEPILINIRDVNGKLIQNKTESVNRGQNVIYINGLEQKQAGVYFISVEQGSQIKQAKFVKTK